MRLAVRLGLLFVLGNAIAWAAVSGDTALPILIGVELGLLMVVRRLAYGAGQALLEARINILILVHAALFMMVMVGRLADILEV